MVVLVVVDRGGGGGWSWGSRRIGGNGHVGVVLIGGVKREGSVGTTVNVLYVCEKWTCLEQEAGITRPCLLCGVLCLV